MAGFFNFDPITTTLETQRLGDLLQSSPTAAAYALMQRAGFRPEASYRSFLAGLAPLLETLRPLYVANDGLPQAQGTDAINAFGQLFQELLRPKATAGNDDLIGRGYEALMNLAKGGFGQGTPQDSYLGNTEGITSTLAALMGSRLGGRTAGQFLNADSIAQLQAQFANRQAQGYDRNWISFLQEMGYMPGDYTQSKPSVPDQWKPKETPNTTPPRPFRPDVLPPTDTPTHPVTVKPQATPQSSPGKFRPDILPPDIMPTRPRTVAGRR